MLLRERSAPCAEVGVGEEEEVVVEEEVEAGEEEVVGEEGVEVVVVGEGVEVGEIGVGDLEEGGVGVLEGEEEEEGWVGGVCVVEI